MSVAPCVLCVLLRLQFYSICSSGRTPLRKTIPSCGGEESLVPQPVGTSLRPGGARMVVLAAAEVVGGACIDVQLRRTAGPLQREVHQHTVLRRADEVVPAVRKEDRWRPARNAEVRSEFILVLRLQVTRIDRNGEVGPATDFVHVIDRLVGSLI